MKPLACYGTRSGTGFKHRLARPRLPRAARRLWVAHLWETLPKTWSAALRSASACEHWSVHVCATFEIQRLSSGGGGVASAVSSGRRIAAWIRAVKRPKEDLGSDCNAALYRAFETSSFEAQGLPRGTVPSPCILECEGNTAAGAARIEDVLPPKNSSIRFHRLGAAREARRAGAVKGEARKFKMELKVRRNTLRMLADGTYVMTSWCEEYGGAPVTWVSQSSDRPPLIVALKKDTDTFRSITGCGHAVLDGVDGQKNRPLHQNEPIVISKNKPSHFTCRVERMLDDVGNHAVVILEASNEPTGAESREPDCAFPIAEPPGEQNRK